MKSFDIPNFYKSSFIGKIKQSRKAQDPMKKDFSPTVLNFGSVNFYLARHFGFCFGVENAIEIAYKAVEENPDKNIYLLSQMIHNPDVNADLEGRGIKFIMDTEGNQLIDWDKITKKDVVIIPAFGTTLETEKKLVEIGINPTKYDTTCPFVTRVWKKSEKLGKEKFTVIIHGKHKHEETRATFSHSKENSPSIIVKDISEAKILGSYILGEINFAVLKDIFEGRFSEGFNFEKDFEKIGVVNQTTMLASETQEIADYFKKVMLQKYGEDTIKNHFSDTRDTLCYATNDNQSATYALLEQNADLAIVVGGYNSSNTSHLVELCENKFPTYYISSAKEILNKNEIQHFNYHEKQLKKTKNYLPTKNPVNIIITSGASCPDAVVDNVLEKLLSYFETEVTITEMAENF